MARFGTVNDVMLDNDGVPLAGGKLYFYDSGTLDAKTTYSDLSETTANANPVVLDAYGRLPDIFFSGSARVRVFTSADVLVDDKDPLPGIEYALQQFADYQATITYSKYAIVRSGDDYYESLQNANTNNTPASSPAWWKKLIFDSVALGLTAGTTQTQAGATAMTASINEFSVVANANDGGALPDDTGIGEQVMVANNGDEDLKVWPASGHSINSGATDAADTAVIASGGRRVYTKQTATKWVYEEGGALITRSARTSNTILGAADNSTLIDFTSGTFTQTITAAATLGSGWFCYLQNSGTGDITLDPNGSETIDGLTTFVMYPGEVRLLVCDGTNFYSAVLSPFRKRFPASAMFTKPPGYSGFLPECVGAGGGGCGATQFSGGAGGAGGVASRFIPSDLVGTTETITVGAGGTGGAANGDNNGTAGGNSTFGSLLTGYGGGFGNGGSGDAGGGGGGIISAGGDGSITGGVGGGLNGGAAGSGSAGGDATDLDSGGGGGDNAAGGNAYRGGGGGGGQNGAGGSALWGPGGGGGGGSGAGGTGNAGGATGSTTPGGGGAGGVGDSQAGANGMSRDWSYGDGGGGGGAGAGSNPSTGGNGGDGGQPGGGGGAAGPRNNTGTGGAGGNGGDGIVRIWGIV